MKNFFKNLWDKIKNFVSEHKPVFETILDVFLALLYIAWAILMLYQFSEVLLSGIEKNSAIRIAFAIAGYIFITWYTYWISFFNRNQDDFRSLRYRLIDIQSLLRRSSIDQILSRSEFKVSMLEQKYEVAEKLREIERKIDKLIEQK
jgi:glucan phosphoethanolaminetransferase (alkaline phosphatase superfamily)